MEKNTISLNTLKSCIHSVGDTIVSNGYIAEPHNQKKKLWRYMDFSKFVSMLSKNSLFLCRADKFTDTFEGAFTVNNSDQVRKFNDFFKQWIYISCWHMNEYESAAMWDLCSSSSESIAIETDFKTLKSCLPPAGVLTMVNYIDYNADTISEENIMFPYVNKRKSFEHEKEVRILVSLFDTLPHKREGKYVTVDFSHKNDVEGLDMPIELNSLIHKIHVSPTAPKWFYEVVQDVCNKYNIKSDIKQSDLYSDPVYFPNKIFV